MTVYKTWTAFAFVFVLALAAACASRTTPAPDSPPPIPETGGTWKAEVVWGCDSEMATGAASWTADLAYEFTVGADNTLSGIGSGTFRRTECTLHGCRCWFEPGPILLDVSGQRQGDTFNIKLVPHYNLTQCTTCPEVETKCGSGIRQLEWCHCSAAGGPLEVDIQVADHKARDFGCNLRIGEGITAFAEGWTEIMRVQP
jgi:hypothetical protein